MDRVDRRLPRAVTFPRQRLISIEPPFSGFSIINVIGEATRRGPFSDRFMAAIMSNDYAAVRYGRTKREKEKDRERERERERESRTNRYYRARRRCG